MKLNIKNAISLIIIVVILVSFLIIPIYARTPGFVGYINGAGAPNYLDGASSVFVSGNYAYVTASNDNSLSIFNISTPTSPTFVGNISGSGAPNYLGGATKVVVSGNYAYVTAYQDDSLTIINISVPTSPTFVGNISGSGAPNYLDGAISLTVSGNYAYVTSNIDNALVIINVSVPVAPAFVSVISGVGSFGSPNYLYGASDVYVSGSYAYVTAANDNALNIINISVPTAPTLTSKIFGAGWLGSPNYLAGARSVVVSGIYAYIAAYNDHSLTIINIATPSTPVFTGRITGGAISPNYIYYPASVKLYGSYAIIASSGNATLTMVDVTTPATPVFSGYISGAGSPNYLWVVNDVYVLGDYAYTASIYDASLSIFQLSLRSPSLIVVDASNVSTSSAKLNANITSAGGEDEGDLDVRYGYGTTSLYNVGTVTDNTGTATGSPISVSGGFTEATYRTTTIVVTAAGTFDITLPAGITGTATSGTATLGGSPVNLPAASTTTVDTGVTTGTFTVLIDNVYDTVTSWESGWSEGSNPFRTISSLLDSTTYYFSAQVKNGAYTTSATNQLSFTTYPAPDNVTYFIGNPLETTLKLAWAMPDGASTVLIRYDTDTFPTTIAEGYEAYNGSSSSTEYPSSAPYLTPGKTYFFSIWGVDNVTYSPGYKTLALTTLGTSFTDISGGDILPPPAFPSNWGGPVDPSVLSNFEPFYSMIGSFATSWGVPTETMWLIIALVIIAFVGFLVLIETQKLMAAVIAVGIGMLAASMMHVLPTYFIAIAVLCFLGAWRIEVSTG